MKPQMCSCKECEICNKLYLQLITGCLCLNYRNDFGQHVRETRLTECGEHVLLHLSVLRVLFEIVKSSDGRVCVKINELTQLLQEVEFGKYLLRLDSTSDKYIAYAVKKAFLALVSYLKTEAVIYDVMENLCKKITDSDDTLKLSLALDTLTNIFQTELNVKNMVHKMSTTNCEKIQLEVKSTKVVCRVVVEVLGRPNGYWTELVKKMNTFTLDYDVRKCYVTLCRKLVQVIKKNHSEDLLEKFITPEVTLFIQTGSATPTLLRIQADMLIDILCDDTKTHKQMSTWRQKLSEAWLMHIQKPSLEISDEILLRKIVLSVFYSFHAVQKPEVTGDSATICWLQLLTKRNLVDLFLDQDDQLIQMMLVVLNLHLNNFVDLKVVSSNLNPHAIFLQFLVRISFDHSVLLDFLISGETQFLLFFTKYLKLIDCEWQDFVQHASSSDSQSGMSLDSAMTTLIQTRLAVERLHDKDLFPYNAEPLLKLVENCENLYETVTND